MAVTFGPAPSTYITEAVSPTLAAAATYNGVTQDLRTQTLNSSPTFTGNLNFRKVFSSVIASVAGTLNLQVSADGVNWKTLSTVAVAAGVPISLLADAVFPFFRTQFVNGAAAQTAISLYTGLMYNY